MSGGRREDLARRLAYAGGALGLLAGITQTLVGSRIPQWSGAKADPTALGLLTVAMSLVALAGGHGLAGHSGPASAGRRAAVGFGLLVPGALCFSTVGRLWLLPGALLLAAAATTVAAGSPGELRAVLSRHWLRILLSVLAGLQLLMAVAAAPTRTMVVGVAGGLAVLATWAVSSRRSGQLLVAVGTLPFAALTWTSLATPLVALLALGIAAAVPPREGEPAAAALLVVPGVDPAK